MDATKRFRAAVPMAYGHRGARCRTSAIYKWLTPACLTPACRILSLSRMQSIPRRNFLRASAALATACAADLSFLAPLGHAAASDTLISPNEVVFGPETDRLLRLIR